MKIGSVGVEFHADGRTDMTRLIHLEYLKKRNILRTYVTKLWNFKEQGVMI